MIGPDVLKAAAIFAVVYIHASGLFGANDAVTASARTFRFCVPVFITVWAYFQERSYARRPSWRANVPGRLLLALTPFLAWSVLYSVLTAAPWSGLAHYVSSQWAGYGWSGQYFFLILLQLIVVFPFLRQVPIGRVLVVTLFGVYAVGFVLLNVEPLPGWFVKVGYRPFVYWLPYVALGVHLARHRGASLPLAAGLAGLLLIAVETLLAWPHPGFDDSYAKPGVLIGSGLMAASLLNRAAPAGKGHGFATRAVSFVGSSTMGIFVLNPLVIRLGFVLAAVPGWQSSLGAASMAILSFGCTALLLLACLVATVALRRAGLGRLVS